MSLEDKLAETSEAIDAIGELLLEAAAQKRQTAKMADVTKALGGESKEVLIDAIGAPLRNHIANPTAHGETLAMVDTYSQLEINNRLNNAPSYDRVPISQYGSPGYLPTGAAGSFEGATSNISGSSMNCPSIMEDDGTMVWLRNGTNGSSVGVYYMYSPGALQGPLTAPIRTTRKYRPPFVPVGKSVAYLFNSGDQVLAGALQDATGAITDYFIAKTNGTFNDTNHTGCLISLAAGGAVFSPSTEIFMGTTDCFIIACVARTVSSDPFEFKVWRVTAAQLISNAAATPTAITTWSTTSFFGARNTANIRLADKWVSATPTDTALLVGARALDPTMNMALFHDYVVTKSAQQNGTNVRTRLVAHIYVADGLNGKTVRRPVVFSFIWNPTTKVAAVDTGVNLPITLASDSEGFPTLSGNMVVNNSEDYVPGSSGGFSLSSYYNASGVWFSYAAYAIADASTHVCKGKCISGAAPMYDALHYSRKIVMDPIVTSSPTFGSAVGGAIAGSTVLPNNRLLVKCTGRAQNGSTASSTALVEKGAAGYTYLSQYGGSMQGYAPNVTRTFLHDMGLSTPDYYNLVSEIAADGSVITTGSHFREAGPLSVPADVSSTLAFLGQVVIPAGIWAIIRNAAYASAGVSNTKADYATMIVPRNAALCAYAMLTFIRQDNSLAILVAELDVVGSRTGTISGFNLLSISPVVTIRDFCSGFTAGPQNYLIDYTGGVTIYEGTDGYFIGGTGKNTCNFIGTDGTSSFAFAVPKNTMRADWTAFFPGITTLQYSANFWTAVPGVGFGYNAQSDAGSDTYTKLSFRLTARNMAEFRTGGTVISKLALVTQDVPEGWLVYFTQTVPALLGGQYYEVPPVTMNLASIKSPPSNSTFYVYLVRVLDRLEYQITEDQLEDTLDIMYLGKISTDASRITSLDIDRVSRIGKYRISSVPAGSAISHNAGPSATPIGNPKYPLLWK